MKNPEELLLETGLYEIHEFQEEDYPNLFNLKFYNSTIDYYCVECKANSTFEGKNQYMNSKDFLANSHQYSLTTYSDFVRVAKTAGWLFQDSIKNHLLSQFYHVKAECTRDRNHKSVFVFRVTDKSIQKIGQYPSIRDLNNNEINKYRNNFSLDYKELNTAIGLYSHGVGAGSLIYLRRIFERLLEEAHNKAKESDDWDKEKYTVSRVNEKIILLKDFLPSFLHENSSIYGILSKGIHELSEQECKNLFPTLNLSIQLILDQKLEQMEKQKKENELKKQLNKINQNLSK